VLLSNDSYAIDKGGSLGLGYVYASGGGTAHGAEISGRKENSTDGDYAGYLSFATAANGGNNTEKMKIDSAGNVYMPSLTQTSVAQTGTVCWSATGGKLTVDTTVACLASSRRFKDHIAPLATGLSTIMALRPVRYRLKDDTQHLGEQVGLLAEEVLSVDTRLVALDADNTPRGVRYMQLTAVLVKAIQEQQAQIEALHVLRLRGCPGLSWGCPSDELCVSP